MNQWQGCFEEQCQMYSPEEIQQSQECNQFTGDKQGRGGGIQGREAEEEANQRQMKDRWMDDKDTRTWNKQKASS